MNVMKTPVQVQKNILETQDELDIFATLNTIWRGKYWIVFCAALGLLGGWYYANKIAKPLYPATAEVAFQAKPKNRLDAESIFFAGNTSFQDLNTEVKVMTSRNLMAKVVETLDLTKDPEFNPPVAAAPSPRAPSSIRDVLTGSKPWSSLFEARETRAAVANPNPNVEKVIDRVRRRFSIENVEFSYVFAITATSSDPMKSVALANTLAELYIASQLEEKFEESEKASAWLSDRAAELKIELENSEAAVKEFNEGTSLVGVEALQAGLRQLKDMRNRLVELNQRRVETQSELDALEQAIQGGDSGVIAAVSRDTQLRALANGLTSGRDVQGDFDARLQTVLAQTERDVARAEQQYLALKSSEETFANDINQQSDDLVQLQQLQREAEANRLLYENFLTRLKETTVQKGLQSADSRMLSPAVARPASSPKKMRIMVIYTVLAGMLGTAAIFIMDMRYSAFRTPEDLEKFTGLTVLGSVPRLPVRTRARVLDYANTHPTSVFSEAIRNLRTSILLSDVDNPPQVIMSTSSTPGEAKTIQSLVLAQNIAAMGKKVLVMECDIRRRVFSEIFSVADQQTFVDVLYDRSTLDEAVHSDEDLGVDILFGSKAKANAADLFSSTKFKDLVTQLRGMYDYIIMDTPPVLVVPDARILGQNADTIVYNVLWDKTPKGHVKQGLGMFESVGLSVSGLVLTKVNIRRLKRYGYGKSYAYGDYKGYYNT